MKQILLFFVLISFIGCVSESEHQKVLDENEELQSEIEELKYGIPNLLKDSKKLFELEDYAAAKKKIETLVRKHPNSAEAREVQKMLPTIEEELLWEKIQETEDLELVESYKDAYPKGKYTKKVYSLRKEIFRKKDRDAYESAKSQNTTIAYNSYLENFPKGIYRNKVYTKKKYIIDRQRCI